MAEKEATRNVIQEYTNFDSEVKINDSLFYCSTTYSSGHVALVHVHVVFLAYKC